MERNNKIRVRFSFFTNLLQFIRIAILAMILLPSESIGQDRLRIAKEEYSELKTEFEAKGCQIVDKLIGFSLKYWDVLDGPPSLDEIDAAIDTCELLGVTAPIDLNKLVLPEIL